MQDNNARSFSSQVSVLFGTHFLATGIGIVNGILLARLLGPEGKGDYYLVVLLPATAVVLVQLGLPQAFGFFTARGQTLGIFGKAFVLTAILSVFAVFGVLVLLPLVRDALLGDLGMPQVVFGLVALPFALNVTFTTAIVMGRQAVRWYAVINTAYPIVTTFLLLIILGGLNASVNGAIAVYLIATTIQSIGFAVGARRVTAARAATGAASYRELFRYGVTFYPASLAGFFSHRADAYLIAFLIADASAALGFYSMAVGLAEMVSFFPRAVSTMFFPRVAGAPREESDRQVAMVSRVTLLVTAVFAVLIIPAAAALIWLVLPAFGESLPPFLVLLPGVVALSAANVIGGYIIGIGRPGVLSAVNVVSFVVNILANLVLIPSFGIVGAAAASLLSYTLSAVVLSLIAAKLAETPVAAFWVVRGSDVRYVVATTVSLLRRARLAAAAYRSRSGA